MYDLNEYYRGLIDSDFEKNAKSAAEQRKYIENSTASYHGRIVYTMYIPKLFTDTMARYFAEITDTMYKIMVKVIKEYEKNPEYRKLFGFDKRLEELILRPDRYKCKLPIARIDIFFNEDDFSFKFCEFNTDGASAMNEDRELYNSLSKNYAFKQFKKKYKTRSYELFDTWVNAFTKIYKTYPGAKENAHVAIVDFMSSASDSEFKVFKEHFIKKGYTCEICEITDLTYSDGKLISPSGKVIDAVYRRAVTCDIMKNYDKVLPFIEAVKNDSVCLIGDFKTQVVHNKRVFKILHDEMTSAFLTEEEREFVKLHIPYTTFLTPDAVKKNDVLRNKDKWVIKPEDSYASKGVYAGVEFDNEEEWIKHVTENIGSDYLLQEYVKPYETVNIDLNHDENAEYRNYSSITGLFVYGGKFKGIYSRIAKNSIISTQYSEMSLASVVVSKKK